MQKHLPRLFRTFGSFVSLTVFTAVVALPFAFESRARAEGILDPATGTVTHPKAKDPIFLSQDLYGKIKKALPPLPKMGSPEQKVDEKLLIELQNARTSDDCEAAKNEVLVSVKSFFGKPVGPLNDEQTQKVTPFLEQVRNDADFFIQKLKVDFPRQRPFVYIKSLDPCVPREVTGAYPSGHALLSKLFALILADLYAKSPPLLKDALEARADEIAKHRVVVGMHHPSDIAAGKKLASLIHEELQKSAAYKKAFSRIVATLAVP